MEPRLAPLGGVLLHLLLFLFLFLLLLLLLLSLSNYVITLHTNGYDVLMTHGHCGG